jgi:branched-chain amino acid aminotransferase
MLPLRDFVNFWGEILIQLQRPPFVFMQGRLTPWDQAMIHVTAEAVIRGISVFEGLKGYWSQDGSTFSLVALREHFERLQRSATLQYLPFPMTYEEYCASCLTLVRELLDKNRDLWVRTTLVSVEGQWGEATITDLVITAYHQDKKKPDPMDIGISTWQRPSDTALPTRIKSAANYQAGRLARIEGRRQGFSDMIMLNSWGRISEASAACVLITRKGKVLTPPASEGCLESVTVDIVEGICKTLGIPFERRPIDRTELAIADSICLAGTVMELGRVKRLEARDLPASDPIFDAISDEYYACLRGVRTNPAIQLTQVDL